MIASTIRRSVDDQLPATGGPFGALGLALSSVLSSALTVSVVPPSSGAGDLTWRLISELDRVDQATIVAGAFVLGSGVSGVHVDLAGKTVTVSSPGCQPGAGRLGDTALYRSAVADVAGRPAVAAFVDLAALTPSLRITAAEAANLKPIAAIEAVSGADGATLAGQIRLVIP